MPTAESLNTQAPDHRWGPPPGLRQQDFTKLCENGFGDGYNAYAYSMAWFEDAIYVGVGRANLHLLKFAMPFVRMDVWPVETPHENYTAEFENHAARGEIWRGSPITNTWTRVFQSPMVQDTDGEWFSRDLGYRAMTIYQGKNDAKPALYVATWSRSKSDGPLLLRSENGYDFDVLPKPAFETLGRDLTFNAIRSLLPFKGRLFTAPVGATKGNVNNSGTSLIYMSDDPASGQWQCINPPGFGTFPAVATVYEMAVVGDWLYAGTGGLAGFEIYRSRAEGEAPFEWEKVMENGAGRGALNQGAVSMHEFNGDLYIGSGIQNGGFDWRNKIGPAAAEIVRLHPDNSWDIVCGNPRDGKQAISGMGAGFGNFFAGYIWRMGVHDGWLYAGTMDWSVILQFTNMNERKMRLAQIMNQVGVDEYLDYQGGCEIWRTADGENWLPVTKRGFENPYNFGCRNLISTPHGLYVGTANPFGPRGAVCVDREKWEWTYTDNPRGGLEIWLGTRDG